MLASVFANAFRGRNQRPFTPADFMPEFWDIAQRQSEKEAETPAERSKRLLSQVEGLNVLFSGRDLRGKN